MLEYDRTDVSAGLEVSKTSAEKYGQEKTPFLDTFHAVFGKKKQKCFVVWEDNEKVMPLCIMLPKMSEYRKNYNETKFITF